MSPGTIAESDLSGNLQSEYVFFNGKRTARINLPGNAVHYYLSDVLNSTSMVVSATSAIENESDYNPWGGELQLSNSDSNHYKFTGKERDGETGLDYFGARYYSNGLGRFLTPDWAAKAAAIPYAELADPQSLNLYSYVRNRLTVQIDPDGHYLLGANGEQMEAEYSENLANLDPSKDCKTCSKTPRHKKKKGPFKPKTKKQVAGTIYNETSTLRASSQTGPDPPKAYTMLASR